MNVKLNCTILGLLFVMICTSAAWATFEQAENAYKAMKKLSARTSAGISYRDYEPALGEVQYAVEEYLESKHAKSNPELSDSIFKAFNHYKWAKTIWALKFSGHRGVVEHIWMDDAKEAIIKRYPDVLKPWGKGGASSDLDGQLSKPNIYIDPTLGIIWSAASDELKTTRILLDTNEAKEKKKRKK